MYMIIIITTNNYYLVVISIIIVVIIIIIIISLAVAPHQVDGRDRGDLGGARHDERRQLVVEGGVGEAASNPSILYYSML